VARGFAVVSGMKPAERSMANVIPPALVSGETHVEPVTPEHTGSATATEVVYCCRGGCIRGRPPLHEGATQARRTASYPEVGARVLRGR